MGGEEQLGKMKVSIFNTAITRYHIEVAPKAGDKVMAKKNWILSKVTTVKKHFELCRFTLVLAQFDRHPQAYDDVWQHTVR